METFEVGGRTYTNKFNLPEEVVSALTRDYYTDETEAPFHESTSTLVAPTQITALKRRHPDKLKTFDVSQKMWSFLGSVSHNILEAAWKESMGSVVEKRFYVTVNGRIVSGKTDCYAPPQIRDYKSCKAYKLQRGAVEGYEEWERAQNCYAYILEENGLPVESLLIIAIVFDWKEMESYKPNYPKAPFVQIPLTLWSKEKQRAYVEERVAALEDAKTLTDEELAVKYPCSKKDMWQDLSGIVVQKRGAERATRKFDAGTKEEMYAEAQAYFQEKGLSHATHEIVERWSGRTRCAAWCDVADVCAQNRRLCLEEGNPLPADLEPTIF